MDINQINKSIRQKETLGRELTPKFCKEIYKNIKDSTYNDSIEKLLKLEKLNPRENVLSKIIEGIKDGKTVNLTKKEESELTPEDTNIIKNENLIKNPEQGVSITPIPNLKELEDKIHTGGQLSDIERKNLENCIEHPKVKKLLDFDKEIEKESKWIIDDSKNSNPTKDFKHLDASAKRAHSKTGFFYGAYASPSVEH